MKKCHFCSKPLDDDSIIETKGCYYMPADLKASNYSLVGRLSFGRGNQAFNLVGSVKSNTFYKGKLPKPICPSCFLSKLKRAVVALETALEGKEPADEEKQEVAATASASAPEVTKEEPFDYDKLTDEEKNRQYWRLFAEKGDEPTELEKRQNRVWTQNEVRRRQLKNLPI